ncbi:MAG: NRDE family protein [Thermoanaerobaculia bacterium]|nr:NRDE family protein [Thermoanaerobaculia bacterium]
MNRDERRGRARAEPPRVRELDGLRAILPRDPDGGGTWIAVNEAGLSLSLLNDHSVQPAEPLEGWISRGQLVLQLAGLDTALEVTQHLAAESLERFRPFQLLTLGPSGEALLHRWNGSVLLTSRPQGPLSSSGYDSAGALEARTVLWTETLAASEGDWTEALPRFHRSHAPERGALSPCMHRAEASTVSLAVVVVTQERVSMAYADGPPCRTELGTALILDRRPRRSIDPSASVDFTAPRRAR